MDPRVKVEGVENILNYIAICMNQPSEPEGKIYNKTHVSNIIKKPTRILKKQNFSPNH